MTLTKSKQSIKRNAEALRSRGKNYKASRAHVLRRLGKHGLAKKAKYIKIY